VLLGVGCQHHRYSNQGFLQQEHGYHGRDSQDEPYSKYATGLLCNFKDKDDFLVSNALSCRVDGLTILLTGKIARTNMRPAQMSRICIQFRSFHFVHVLQSYRIDII
jgi:hypothetical protein